MSKISFLSCIFFITLFSYDNEEAISVDATLTQRDNEPCGPQGLCDPTAFNQVISVNVGGCTVEVTVSITTCYDPSAGMTTVYFEDENEAISITGSCPGVDIAFIEASYAEAIFRYLEAHYEANAPTCSSGGSILQSKQIKMQCQKYCIGPGPVGETNYYWTPCATVQSCCIETQKWCVDGEGNLVKDGPSSSEDEGECSGFFEGTCFQQPSPINYNPCKADRCSD